MSHKNSLTQDCNRINLCEAYWNGNPTGMEQISMGL